MVASQAIRVDMEVKQALIAYKTSEWEPFNEVVKRLILIVSGKNPERLNESEKKAILKAISSVEKGRTESFDSMLKNIQKKRTASKGGKKVGKLKDYRGNGRDKDAMEH